MIIGLTGSFGSGKTTVAKIFKSYGAKIIDADKIARSLVLPGKTCYEKIVKSFGSRILNNNGSISRKKLSVIVFRNNKLLARLNRIIHPQVIKIIKKEIRQSEKEVTILDVPLLFETRLDMIVDRIIVVKLNKSKQISRLLEKTSLKKEDIISRVNAQMGLSEKLRRADFIIDNNMTTKETKKQVKKFLKGVFPTRKPGE